MTGDTADMLARLKMVLPRRWFADTTPVLDALLTGLGAAWSGLYTLLGNVKAQTRIGTASGVFLDVASEDFLGAALPRRVGESDTAYRLRIQQNLLAPRATRASVVEALVNLTGRQPRIFEPLNASDPGGYDTGTLGYGVCGGYGSINLPFQFFVTAYRPNATPISNAGGYNSGPGGFGCTPMLYADTTIYAGVISDAEIYTTIAAALPTCGVAWTTLLN